MIKMGKIQNDPSTSNVVKNLYVAYKKKKEGETNATTVVWGRALTYYASYKQVAVVAPILNQQPYDIPVDQRANQQPVKTRFWLLQYIYMFWW